VQSSAGGTPSREDLNAWRGEKRLALAMSSAGNRLLPDCATGPI
jgi:hypothetical protein